MVINSTNINKMNKVGVMMFQNFQQYFSYIVVVSFIVWWRRLEYPDKTTDRKSLTNFIT